MSARGRWARRLAIPCALAPTLAVAQVPDPMPPAPSAPTPAAPAAPPAPGAPPPAVLVPPPRSGWLDRDPLFEGWYFPTGVEIGAAFTADGDPGLVLGLETSVVYLTRGFLWAGALLGARYDHGVERGYASLGLEGGYAFIGAEAALDVRDDGALGGRLRVVVPFVAAGLYGGLSTHDGDRFQVGVQLKWPIGLD